MDLDLSDLSSIRKFAGTVQKQFPKIDILINCAGVYDTSGKLEYTKEGFEMHFGVNHLGHFLLTNLLISNLKAGAPSRSEFVHENFPLGLGTNYVEIRILD
jgi:NAD(P)-dependent dehydrogenase (short-subunit alcohol dehydrogenase family)